MLYLVSYQFYQIIIQTPMHLDISFFVRLVQCVSQSLTFWKFIERYVIGAYLTIPALVTQVFEYLEQFFIHKHTEKYRPNLTTKPIPVQLKNVTPKYNSLCVKNQRFLLRAYSAMSKESTLLSSIFLHRSFFLKSMFGKSLRAALIDVGFGSTVLYDF